MPIVEFAALGILVITLVGLLWQPFGTKDWMWTIGAAGIVLAAGLLSIDNAESTLASVSGVLLFLFGVAIVAELSSHAGVFQHAAFVVASWAKGSQTRLFVWVFALTAFATSIFSLDGAVVVMTPVVIHLARMRGVQLLPLAFTVVFVANCGSLLFPMSNLTNLLAVEQLNWSFFYYTQKMWLPALLVLLTTAVMLWLWFRKDLVARYEPAETPTSADPALRKIASVVCAFMLPSFFVAGLIGFGVEWIALGAAFILAVTFLLRGHRALEVAKTVPWQVLFFVIGLFLVVAAAVDSGLGQQVAHIMARLSDPGLGGVLGSMGLATLLANLVNNLPAFLIIGPDVMGSQMSAVLVGVNAGPMLTPIGSLATVLWLHLLRRHDAATPSFTSILTLGIVATPPIVLVGALGVWLTV